jgi:hypothetical protein
MARLNEILVGRFNRGLQRVYGIKGHPPVATLAPEIMPVHSIFFGQEQRWNEGWTRYGLAVVLTGTTGVPSMQIRNPAGSGLVVVVERVFVDTITAGRFELQYGTATPDLTTSLNSSTRSMDARNTAKSAAVLSSNVTVGAGQIGGTVLQASVAGSTVLDFLGGESANEFPVLPNDALRCQFDTVAVTVDMSFIWRERFLEEGERI